MAGSLASIRFSTMWRSMRSLSRTMRTHWKEMAEHDENFRHTMKSALEVARQKGDVEEIHRLVDQFHKEIHVEGEFLLEDDEKKAAGAEIKFIHIIDDLPKLLRELKQAVANSDLEQKERNELNAMINTCKTLLKKMEDAMLDGIEQQYKSVFAEERASHGQDEHRILAERIGLHINNLAEASKQIYKLRSDKRKIKGDVSAIDDLVETIEKEVGLIGKKHDKVKDMLNRIRKQEGDLVQDVKQILSHVSTTFHRFSIIMQIFTAYFFMLQADDKYMEGFIHNLQESNFPHNVLDEITEMMRKDEKRSQAEVKNLQNAFARLRRPMQTFSEQLEAA